ncbi:MAG: 16S rRNA (cytidine(1402)-2'-O)-methyltransferase, partial [Gammaproteobacteria bacterium]
YHLVHAARQQDIRVIPIPGACALIAALSASGLPTDKFVFEGFLPVKSGTRVHRLTELKYETRTLIFYESPHRVRETLRDMRVVLGDSRAIVIARELTKTFETITSGSLGDIEILPEQQRGEFVLLLKGVEAVEKPFDTRILEILLTELPLKQAVKLAAQLSGVQKNKLYDFALKHLGESS